MRMKVVLTKKEFEDALTNAVNCYADKPLVEAVYPRLDGGIEFTLTTLEGPPTEEPAGEMPRPRLWTPDPPPFIHSVEPAVQEQAPPRTNGEFYPPVDYSKPFGTTQSCYCKRFSITENYGYVHNDKLHTLNDCEGLQPLDEPAISSAAALSASSTGEHGTVDGDDDIPF